MSFVINAFSSLHEVADQAIKQIQANWTDPFEEPIVLFSSANVQKWFTKYWIQKEGVVANVNSPSLEHFLWKSLNPDEGDTLLSAEKLQMALLAALQQDEYWKTVPTLKTFLGEDPEEAAFPAKIVDLAANLAAKFREYEFAFCEDFIKAWTCGESYFTGAPAEALETEKWQRDLYAKVFSEGLGACSLPQLYMKKKGEADLFKNLAGKTIVLIGLFSVGKFYRDMIEAIGKVAQVTLYVPAVTCSEKPEWTRFSESNLKLWKPDAAGIKSLEIPENIEIVAAPSKLREIENLYQKVWEAVDSGIRLDDMLVLVPNLDDYRPSIERVFEGFSLPHNYASSSMSMALVSKVAMELLEMATAGEISRSGFLALVRNPLVQKARGFNRDQCDAFEKWVEDVCMYREKVADKPEEEFSNQNSSINPVNSWSFGIRRLLLNRLSTEKVVMGETYYPYSDIESSDTQTLEVFCKLVDDVETFIRERNEFVDDDNGFHYWKNIDLLKSFIGITGFEEEVPTYRSLLRVLYAVKDLDFLQVKFFVMGALSGVESDRGKFLLNGLTFARFSPEMFVPMKRIFMVGMNSSDFPGSDNESTLDIRVLANMRESLKDGVAQNHSAFFNELISAEKVYISYLNKNLKTDAECYASSIVSELKEFKSIPETVLTLDENGEEESLLSLRRVMRKHVDSMLLGKKLEVESKLKNLPPMPIPEDFDVRTMAKFLENPFEFQIKQVLNIRDERDATAQTLEPIEADNIQLSVWNKMMFAEYREHAHEFADFAENFKSPTKEKLDLMYSLDAEIEKDFAELTAQREVRAQALKKEQKIKIKDARDIAASEMPESEDLLKKRSELAGVKEAIGYRIKSSLNVINRKIATETWLGFINKLVADGDVSLTAILDDAANRGYVPKHPTFQEQVANTLKEKLVYQAMNYSGVPAADIVRLEGCSGKAGYKHVLSLYLDILQEASQKTEEREYNCNITIISGGDPTTNKCLDFSVGKQQAADLMALIQKNAYEKRFAANIPCEVIGSALDYDGADQEDVLESIRELYKYPSREAVLFCEDDWNLDNWAEPWGVYRAMVSPLVPPVAEPVEESVEEQN